jgi:hypothetical protein
MTKKRSSLKYATTPENDFAVGQLVEALPINAIEEERMAFHKEQTNSAHMYQEISLLTNLQTVPLCVLLSNILKIAASHFQKNLAAETYTSRAYARWLRDTQTRLARYLVVYRTRRDLLALIDDGIDQLSETPPLPGTPFLEVESGDNWTYHRLSADGRYLCREGTRVKYFMPHELIPMELED